MTVIFVNKNLDASLSWLHQRWKLISCQIIMCANLEYTGSNNKE